MKHPPAYLRMVAPLPYLFHIGLGERAQGGFGINIGQSGGHAMHALAVKQSRGMAAAMGPSDGIGVLQYLGLFSAKLRCVNIQLARGRGGV